MDYTEELEDYAYPGDKNENIKHIIKNTKYIDENVMSL